jgi:hypothetical protein
MFMHPLRPYTIPRGHHRPQGWFFRALCSFLWRRPHFMQVDVMFADDCWYEVTRGVNDQLQKLVGYSRGHHHQNSKRIAWLPDDNVGRFRLYRYDYVKGKLPPPREHCTLIGIVCVGQVTRHVVNRVYEGPWWGYRLWPHFEGPDNAGAPQSMTLYLATRLLY